MMFDSEKINETLFRQGMRIVRLLLSFGAAAVLFAILPFTRTIITMAKGEQTPKHGPVLVMQQMPKKKEPSLKNQHPIRSMASRTSADRSSRSMGLSTRFAPDLSVGSSGDGVGLTGGSGGGDAVFDENSVDEPPKPVSREPVEYPRRARDAGIEGTVSLILVIDRNGKVLTITIESSPSPLFNRAVEQTVSRWKFTPAKNQGVPVQVRMRQNITFKLDS
ncbi:MAG: energy transducer TonB [Chitinispirillaceae bacterium]|nr:energy transducer TonB [Chitinispirillaceae bacterium]